MLAQLTLVLVTAVLTSACTIAAAWVIYDRHLKKLVWEAIDEKAEGLGLLIKQRVSEGVREGIKSSFVDLPDEAAKQASRTGRDLLEESINFWFGGPRRRD